MIADNSLLIPIEPALMSDQQLASCHLQGEHAESHRRGEPPRPWFAIGRLVWGLEKGQWAQRLSAGAPEERCTACLGVEAVGIPTG